MKKKTKITLIASSTALILLAGAGVIGGTYALFTSESKVNITVKSGNIDIIANVSEYTTYSGKTNSLVGNPTNDEANIVATAVNGTFTNGGTATLKTVEGEADLKLANITPGDKVAFKISITNKSNIAIKYRVLFSKGDGSDDLYNALTMTFGSLKTIDGSTKTNWSETAINAGLVIDPLDCSISLATDKGNDYQGKSCSVVFKVEAIQGNAATSND